jgi:hypothetical protein
MTLVFTKTGNSIADVSAAGPRVLPGQDARLPYALRVVQAKNPIITLHTD